MSTPAASGSRLADLFARHDSQVSDKWEHYFAVYEAFLAPMVARGTPLRLLEIGVQNGGSLEIWAKYLPSGSAITGMDIDPRCAELRMPPGVRILIGDATDRGSLDRLLGDETFDVIIDDGSHRSPDIIATFEACFHRIKPGGVFFVEDMHASYWAGFGGGFRDPGAAMEWFKSLTDAVNADHFEPSAGSGGTITMLKELGDRIEGVSFFDSMVVVTRFDEPKRAPFRRLLTGTSAPVFGLEALTSFLTPGLAPQTADARIAELATALRGAQADASGARRELAQAQADLSAARREAASIRSLTRSLCRAVLRNLRALAGR